MKDSESTTSKDEIPFLSKKLLRWICTHHRVKFKEISKEKVEKKTNLKLKNIKRPIAHLIEIKYSHEQKEKEKEKENENNSDEVKKKK